MKKIIALALILMANVSFACSLSVSNGYVKVAVPGMDNSSGYLDLTNTSDEDIVITGAGSTVAKATELHTMSMSDDKMVMRQIKSITVPAGQTVNMQGKFHLMFIGLTQSLKEGDNVNIKLFISGQAAHEITLPVQTGPNKHGHDHDEKHHHHHGAKDDHGHEHHHH